MYVPDFLLLPIFNHLKKGFYHLGIFLELFFSCGVFQHDMGCLADFGLDQCLCIANTMTVIKDKIKLILDKFL